MATLGRLVVEITGDATKLNKDVDQSQKKIKGLSTAAKAGVAIVATAVAAAAFQIGKSAIDAASRFEETQSKFNTVFSDLQDEADATAENFEKNFGLSSLAARQLLSDTGDLLTGFGFTQESALELSTQVNELAVDLASFTNYSGGAEGASAALTKALLGERESIKSLGIAITEADIKQLAEDKGIVGTLDRQTKAALTLEIAIRQSKNAIGDFARTQESFANQSRIAASNTEDLLINIGQKLQPAAAAALNVFNNLLVTLIDLTSNETELSKTTKTLIELTGQYTVATQRLETEQNTLTDTQRNLLELDRDLAQIKALETFVELNKAYNDQNKRLAEYNNNLNKSQGIQNIINRLRAEEKASVVTIGKELIGLVGKYEAQQILTPILQNANSELEAQQALLKVLQGLQVQYGSDAININKELENGINAVVNAINANIIGVETLSSAEDGLRDKILQRLKNQTELSKEAERSSRIEKERAQQEKLAQEQAAKRVKIENEIISINKELAENIKIAIDQQAVFGDEIDLNQEKAAAYKTALQDLINLGLSPQAPLLLDLTAKYKEYANVTTDSINDQKKFVDELNDAWENGAKAGIEARQEATEAELEAIKSKDEALQESNAKELAYIEATKQAYFDLAGYISDIFGSIITIQNNAAQKRINNIDAQIEAEKNSESVNEDLIEQLEAKKIKIQREAAGRQKAAAIVAATINTSEAISKALTGAPPPFNAILAAAASIAGGAQIAAIASQPLAFRRGGLVNEPTFATIGEGGRSEAVLPLEDRSAMELIAGSIVDAMQIPVNNVTNNYGGGMEGPVTLLIDGSEFNGYLTSASRRGAFLIDSKRGVV